MKRYLILTVIMVISSFFNIYNSTMALFASPSINILYDDTLSTYALSKPNVDTTSFIKNVSNEKSHDTSVNLETPNKTHSSTTMKDGHLEETTVRKTSDVKREDIINQPNSTQDFNAVILSVDTLKHTIESMSQTNDSIRTILSEVSNSSENRLNLYCKIFLVLFFVSVLFVIMLVKKCGKILKHNTKEQTDVIFNLQNQISVIENMQSKLIDNVQSCNNEITRMVNQVEYIGTSLKTVDKNLDVAVSKLNNTPIVQSVAVTPTIKNSEEPQITNIQYNDAILEFEKINNRLFKLRKCKLYSQELLRFLSTGEINKEKYTKLLVESDLSDVNKEHLQTIMYDIERFNTQRRELISKYISQQKLTCFDIRFPLFAEFDDELDHNFKGDDVAKGDKITRVCKLGYYFPKSNIAPYRVKCEVDTEKEE